MKTVKWTVESTDEFERWWRTLSERQQDDVGLSIGLLEDLGPALDHPHSTKIVTSRYAQMRELRTQSGGRPLRTLYAFDPLRVDILLIGGDKTGWLHAMDRRHRAFEAAFRHFAFAIRASVHSARSRFSCCGDGRAQVQGPQATRSIGLRRPVDAH